MFIGPIKDQMGSWGMVESHEFGMKKRGGLNEALTSAAKMQQCDVNIAPQLRPHPG